MFRTYGTLVQVQITVDRRIKFRSYKMNRAHGSFTEIVYIVYI